MIRQANILFIQSSTSGDDFGLQNSISRDAYYQRLIFSFLSRYNYTKEGFESLGRQLTAVAHQAYLSRQMDAVEQASQLMLTLPISARLGSVARYYQALCTTQKGDYSGARNELECVLEEAPPQYKARALLSIGTNYIYSSKAEASLPFFFEAGKVALNSDLFTLVGSQKMIAVVRSIYGDHKQALIDLESLFPTVRAIAKEYPAFYYEFLNSLAVELGEVGRITEAEAALGIALASPFAAAYPEFAETRDEIAAKRASASHSVVAVNVAPERKIKRRHAFKFSWLARKDASFQTSLKTIALNAPTSRTVLDRVFNCVRPRSPPALF